MNLTALNINANTLKVLARRGNAAVNREVALPPGSLRNGLILQPDAVAAEISKLFKSAGLSGHNVIVSVNGLPFSYRVLTVPALENTEFAEAVVRAARKEMSISPDEMYLSWQAYPAQNNEIPVLVAGITRHPVDTLIKTLTAAGIRPWLMDLPHLALARVSPFNDCIIIDYEKDCSNIVMMVDGVPRGLHMVPAFSAAASLQDQLAQVTDKLSKMVDFYNGSHPVKPIKEPAKVLVTGELLEEEKAFGYLQPQVGHPVEYLTPAKNLPFAWPLHRQAVNAGAALLGAGMEKGSEPRTRYFSLETIVSESRPRADVQGLLKKVLVPFGVMAALGFLVISCLSLQNVSKNVADLKTELNLANMTFDHKKDVASQAHIMETNIAELKATAAEIRRGRAEIYASQEYVDNINNIFSSMPEGMTFTNLEIGRDIITLEGVTLEAAPVVTFAGSLQTDGGFPKATVDWIDKPHLVDKDHPEYYFRVIIYRTAEALES